MRSFRVVLPGSAMDSTTGWSPDAEAAGAGACYYFLSEALAAGALGGGV